MKVLEYAPAYGLELNTARRLTDDEKSKYMEWFQEIGLICTGTHIKLSHLRWDTPEVYAILQRGETGQFPGCSNSCYKVSDAEWDMLIALDGQAASNQRIHDLEQSIQGYRATIAACEQQGTLYTVEEARREWTRYNNANNEGGYGFVPHFWTQDEYDGAKAKLSAALSELAQLKGERA